MKKVFMAIALIATVACFTSCAKTCKCKYYVNGTVERETETELSDSFTKDDCNKITAMVGSTGVECKAGL